MMNAWWIAFLAVMASVVGLLAWAGLLLPVKFKKRTCGPFALVGQEYIGPYHKVGSEFRRICGVIEQKAIPGAVAAGLFFDIPSVAGDKGRSFVGMLVPPSSLSGALQSWFSSQQLVVRQLPETQAYVSHFPFRGYFSFMFAAGRTYSSASRLDDCPFPGLNDQGSLEVYGKKTIDFYLPVDNLEAWKYQSKKLR